jgi:hypothetical protein
MHFFVGMAVLVIAGMMVSVLIDIWPKAKNVAILGGIVFLYYLGWHGFESYENMNVFLWIFVLFLEFGFLIPIMGVGALGDATLSLIGS